MKLRATISAAALAIVLFGGIISQPSSGQQQFPPSNRKPACGCYVCGLLLTVEFPNKDKDCYGILATDACPVQLARMPAETRKAACKQLKEKSKGGSLDACLILKQACESDGNQPPDNCVPPPAPWFGPDPPCKDAHHWQIAAQGGTVTVSMCGQIVFKNPKVGTDKLFSESYIGALRDHLRSTIGEKVCCDKFLEAMATGMPCDPRKDVDCDGRPNSEDDSRKYPDDDSYFPNIDMPFRAPSNATIDRFPPGLNVRDIYPSVESCRGCQWELMKGELKCNVATPGGKRHVYQAKWKCPSTGVEVDTFKYASATAPCEK